MSRYYDGCRTGSTELTFPGAAGAGVDEHEAAAWTALSSVLLNLDEFITRE